MISEKDLISKYAEELTKLTHRAITAEIESSEYKELWLYTSKKCEELKKQVDELQKQVKEKNNDAV